MNDEIKEILEELENMYEISELEEQVNNINKIRDYITNLQQENEYLKLNNPEMNIEHFRIINENKRKIDNLRKQNKELQQENERLKEEYINIKNYIVLRNVDSAVQDKATLYNIELENINKKRYLDYKSRCEKAVEQVKEKIKGYKETINMLITTSVENKRYEISELRYKIREQEDLLNILQNGSDSQ